MHKSQQSNNLKFYIKWPKNSGKELKKIAGPSRRAISVTLLYTNFTQSHYNNLKHRMMLQKGADHVV